MIKYMTGRFPKAIESVEIERETESSVWIKGSRRNKILGRHRYYDTWAEAKKYLIDKTSFKVRNCQLSLDSAKHELSKLLQLKK